MVYFITRLVNHLVQHKHTNLHISAVLHTTRHTDISNGVRVNMMPIEFQSANISPIERRIQRTINLHR